MPFAERDGTRLYWEDAGSGDPVLLIMGLGMNATGWWRTVPVLAEHYRVLAFDNRGVGRSDRPPGPYSMPMLADDAVAILDAAGEQRAHVYGISLGGMIAQEVVLRQPDRVRGLVLGATTAGGNLGVPAGETTLGFFRRRGDMPAEEGVWASVPYNYSPRTRREHGDRISEDIAQRLRYPIESAPYLAQLEAALGHDTARSLMLIAAPTLVVHGEADVMVPPANGERLAAAIPGAEHRTWPDTAHLYFTDEPEVDRYVAEWLRTR
jgi:pimeloyl-ACP methyl ester carboxylesterase